LFVDLRAAAGLATDRGAGALFECLPVEFDAAARDVHPAPAARNRLSPGWR